MAIIPKKSKTNNVSDSISIEIAIFLLAIYLIFDTLFSDLVASNLILLFGAYIILIFVYLLLGNKKNKGHIGYERIIIFMKFKYDKLMLSRSKHLYKTEEQLNEKNKAN